MLFLKNTVKTVAPGVFAVDVAAKPPGKTFDVFMAVDADNPPQALLDAMEALGYHNQHTAPYVHNDGKKVLDIRFHKVGTDLFQGWSESEKETNLQAIASLFAELNIEAVPRVMTLAEAFR